MQVKEYLKNLNIHKSVEPDDLNLGIWRELANAGLEISTPQQSCFTIIVYQTTLLLGSAYIVKYIQSTFP